MWSCAMLATPRDQSRVSVALNNAISCEKKNFKLQTEPNAPSGLNSTLHLVATSFGWGVFFAFFPNQHCLDADKKFCCNRPQSNLLCLPTFMVHLRMSRKCKKKNQLKFPAAEHECCIKRSMQRVITKKKRQNLQTNEKALKEQTRKKKSILERKKWSSNEQKKCLQNSKVH